MTFLTRKAKNERKVNRLFNLFISYGWYIYRLEHRYSWSSYQFSIVDRDLFWYHQDLNRTIAFNHAKYLKGKLIRKKGHHCQVAKEFYKKPSDPRRIWKEDLEDLKYE